MMMNFKIYHTFYLVALFLLALEPCVDVSADSLSPEEIYKKSQGVAKGSTPKLEELARGGEGVNKMHEILQNKEGKASHQTLDLGDLPSIGEKAKEDASHQQCVREDCNVANVMSTKSFQAREAKLEAYGFKKDNEQFMQNDKGYIDKARHNAKKYESKFNAITGSYKDCQAKSTSRSFKENLECDEYYDVKYSNCPITQIVEIDPKYTYQCSKKREESIKTCHDEITSITCRKSSECENAGIVASSIKDDDMKFKYENSYLTLGTIGINYWESYCKDPIDRTVEFEIKNKEQISNFRIIKIGFDDYILIKVNDHTVYVGPDGGDRLEIIKPGFRRGVTTNGQNFNSCERNTNWVTGSSNLHAVDIDLKRLLKEGKNTIYMRVVVYHLGHGWMQIKASQHCCRDEDWIIKRETTCTHEEL